MAFEWRFGGFEAMIVIIIIIIIIIIIVIVIVIVVVVVIIIIIIITIALVTIKTAAFTIRLGGRRVVRIRPSGPSPPGGPWHRPHPTRHHGPQCLHPAVRINPTISYATQRRSRSKLND